MPCYDANGRQELTKRRREIVRADHLPAMSYADLAIVTRNLMLDPAIAGRAYLVVDASGVGRAFCDILNTKSPASILSLAQMQMVIWRSRSVEISPLLDK